MSKKKKKISYKKRKIIEKRNTILSAAAVTVIIFTVSLFTLMTGDREYSDNENRYLAQKPEFSIGSVADGRFMKDEEEYLSDQFFARDAMVRMRTGVDVLFGKRESNGVYIGKDGFLFNKPSAYDKKRVKLTTDAINSISELSTSIRSYIAIAPNSVEILSDLLPSFAPTQNQTKQIEKVYSKLDNIQKIDLCTPLKAAKDPRALYYKTDHHWTADAAEIAFNAISREMKLDTSGYKYKKLAVTDSFRGTMASSSGVFSAQDTIRITVPEPQVKYVVRYPDDNKKRASIFDSEKLEKGSKYEVFFSGNFPEIQIETAARSDKTLMVIKDSYANCVVPMLIPYFKTIIMIDPRYYADNISQTIEKNNVTDILWLYNADTFLKDTSIADKFS